MSKTIRVEVTKDDIRGASTNVCTMDPITQAMRRAVGLLPAAFEVNGVLPDGCGRASRFDAFTQPTRIYAKGPNGLIACEAPPVVRERILAWDAKGTMEPFAFEVQAAKADPLFEFLFPGCTMPSFRASEPGASRP